MMTERLSTLDRDEAEGAHGVEKEERLGAERSEPSLKLVSVESLSQTKIKKRIAEAFP